MKDYTGKLWRDIDDDDKKELLSMAICRDFLTGSPVEDSEGLIEFSETLVTLGKVHSGKLIIDDNSELYNPCIGESGPMSQQELDNMYEDYTDESLEDFEKRVYEFEKSFKKRPHVVLLGAGASVATILNGDKNGKKISAMKGFIKELGLQNVIAGLHLKTSSDNLEDIYMEMYERSDCSGRRVQLEEAIEKYLCEYELPDEPTVYDFLILSLTKKDLIATFNWDPLLVEAFIRCSEITNNLPQMAFLHGNIAVATCEKDMVLGSPYGVCSKCGNMLKKVPLLYPIKNKNYKSNPYITTAWEQLEQYLQTAYRVTIFGYSAPKSDKAAIAMLKNAWGAVEERNLEEIEIIDISPEEDVIQSWDAFIHTHHYSVFSNFFDSSLGKFPRRTCELLFDNTQKNMWMHGNKGFKKGMTFTDINSFLAELIKNENSEADILHDPYV